MLKPRLAPVALGALAVFVAAMVAYLVYEVRQMDLRLVALERERADARAARPAAGPAAAPRGPGGVLPLGPGLPPGVRPSRELVEVAAEVKRLREVVQGLESRVNDVHTRTGKLAQAAAERDKAAVAAAADPAAQAVAAGKEAAEKAAKSIAQTKAGYKAWMNMELDKMAEAVGMNDAQKDQARAAVDELFNKYFTDADLSNQSNWSKWGDFQKEWTEKLKGLMTSEQQNQYTTYETKQRQEQVAMSVQWTVSTLEESCGLNKGQRERISNQVKEYYSTVWEKMNAGEYSKAGAEQFKESIKKELTVEQYEKFEEWYKTNMSWAGGQTASGEATEGADESGGTGGK